MGDFGGGEGGGPSSSSPGSSRKRRREFGAGEGEEEMQQQQKKRTMYSRLGSIGTSLYSGIVKGLANFLHPAAQRSAPVAGSSESAPSPISRERKTEAIPSSRNSKKDTGDEKSTQVYGVLAAIEKGKKRGFSREEINLYVKEMKNHMVEEDDDEARPPKRTRVIRSPDATPNSYSRPPVQARNNGVYPEVYPRASPFSRGMRPQPFSVNGVAQSSRQPGRYGQAFTPLYEAGQPLHPRNAYYASPLSTTRTAQEILQALDRLSSPMILSRNRRLLAPKMQFLGGLSKRSPLKKVVTKGFGEQIKEIKSMGELPSRGLPTGTSSSVNSEKSFQEKVSTTTGERTTPGEEPFFTGEPPAARESFATDNEKSPFANDPRSHDEKKSSYGKISRPGKRRKPIYSKPPVYSEPVVESKPLENVFRPPDDPADETFQSVDNGPMEQMKDSTPEEKKNDPEPFDFNSKTSSDPWSNSEGGFPSQNEGGFPSQNEEAESASTNQAAATPAPVGTKSSWDQDSSDEEEVVTENCKVCGFDMDSVDHSACKEDEKTEEQIPVISGNEPTFSEKTDSEPNPFALNSETSAKEDTKTNSFEDFSSGKAESKSEFDFGGLDKNSTTEKTTESSFDFTGATPSESSKKADDNPFDFTASGSANEKQDADNAFDFTGSNSNEKKGEDTTFAFNESTTTTEKKVEDNAFNLPNSTSSTDQKESEENPFSFNNAEKTKEEVSSFDAIPAESSGKNDDENPFKFNNDGASTTFPTGDSTSSDPFSSKDTPKDPTPFSVGDSASGQFNSEFNSSNPAPFGDSADKGNQGTSFGENPFADKGFSGNNNTAFPSSSSPFNGTESNESNNPFGGGGGNWSSSANEFSTTNTGGFGGGGFNAFSGTTQNNFTTQGNTFQNGRSMNNSTGFAAPTGGFAVGTSSEKKPRKMLRARRRRKR